MHVRIFRRFTVKSFLWLCTSQWSYNLTVALPTELEVHVIKFPVLQNHSARPLVVRAVALLFRLRRVALTSRIICSRIALRRCPARSGSLYPPLAALTSGAPKSKEKSRRLPIFPGRLQPSIFGTTELNFCVRNGNRWDLCVIGTGHICSAYQPYIFSLLRGMHPQN